MKKVWFVTGASKGLGLALVKQLLKEGYNVAATSRSKESLIKAVGEYNEKQLLALETDLTNELAVKQAIDATHKQFGRIDVLVNNAGYGIGGAVEELSSKEIHDAFDVNVFAPIYTMKAVMPYLRQQNSGHIINIASIAGFAAATGWSMYAATKFSLIGMSEVMAEDVKEFGVKVTVVAPGAFRTAFLTGDSLVYSAEKIDAYTNVHATHEKYNSMDGNQAGDPDKAASVFIKLAESEAPPVTLFMGSDAYNRAVAKVNMISKNLEANSKISFSTDFK